MKTPSNYELFCQHNGLDWCKATEPSLIYFAMKNGKVIDTTATGSRNRLPVPVLDALNAMEAKHEAKREEYEQRKSESDANANPEVRTSKPQ